MFDNIKRMLELVEVRQTPSNIVVTGIPANIMARDIVRIWQTSKITKNMFVRIDRSSFIIPNFFALDIFYAIETIIKDRTILSSVRVLRNLLDKLLQDTWLASTVNKDIKGRLNFSKLEGMFYKPLPFQMDFLNIYNTTLDKYRLKGYLLAAAAGAGKTNCALTLANCLEANLVVVMCPKNATERVWEDSIKNLFKLPQTYWLANSGAPIKGNERFLVGHYEALETVAEATMRMIKKLGHSAKVMIILDESHNLNEINSLRTERFLKLCKDTSSENILWMSGTAIKALGSESIPLLKSIDPYFTDDSQDRFRKIFGKDAKKGLDILKNRIGIVSFKVEKKELDLLDPIIESVKVVMPTGHKFTLAAIAKDMQEFAAQRKTFYAATEKQDTKKFYDVLDAYEASLGRSREDHLQYQEYRTCLRTVIACYLSSRLRDAKEESIFCNKYEKIIIASLKDSDKELFRHVKTIAKYVLLKIQGECLGRVLSRKRIECHVDMVSHIDFVDICGSTAKKTVVFTSFVEALKEANETCAKRGLSPRVVYGETNSELVSILKEFESNPDINPLIATYNSLSTAVPLIMADTMITINFPFRDYVFQQAVSRIHRLGADTQTYVYTVTLDTGMEPNISTRSADILVWSQKQVTAILGIESPFEIIDGQTPSLEQLEQGVFLKISTEDYDVSEVVTFESLKDLVVMPAYARW